MKVGISTSVIQRGRSGVGQHVLALTRALAERGDIELFLFALEEDLPLFAEHPEAVRRVVVPERFRPAVRNIVWHQSALPRYARRLKLDVVHTPSYRRMLWRRPCSLVATIHDLAPFHLSGKYDPLRMFYGRRVAKQLAYRQDRIIAISGHTARDVERFFEVPADRISVVFNGIDHRRFRCEEAAGSRALAAQRWGVTGPFFLYVARLEHPGKNHIRLIEAFETFKDRDTAGWTLVLAGSDWHGAPVIHDRVRGSRVARDIRSLGFVAADDLPLLYRAADVFVYPSLFEGFGLPPVEAMACGCPVVCSDRGALGEIVGDAALIVDPERSLSIAQGLELLARDRERRECLRTAGLQRARCFTWERAAAATFDVYCAACRHSAANALPAEMPLAPHAPHSR